MATGTNGADGGERDYVLGVNPAELERLGLQHRLWADAAHALWRRAGFTPGWRVLDVGCGPGFATLDIAQLVGLAAPDGARGEVVGVDESTSYLEYLNAQVRGRGLDNVRTAAGNATRLGEVGGLGPASFDAAYARWVMCFVDRPEAVIEGVRALLKPGGRLVMQDYFNYEAMCTAPRRPAFAKTVEATGRAWRSRGGDPDVVGRLPGLLAAGGFDLIHLDVNQRLARPDEPMWQWPESFWKNFLPVLVEMGLLSEADRRAWLEEWDQLARTPGAFVLLPPVFDLIAVKRG